MTGMSRGGLLALAGLLLLSLAIAPGRAAAEEAHGGEPEALTTAVAELHAKIDYWREWLPAIAQII